MQVKMMAKYFLTYPKMYTNKRNQL